jgi:hypothetical protein
MPYNFGENSPISSLKENEKTDVKLIFGVNCMILKKFSEGKVTVNGSKKRRKNLFILMCHLQSRHCLFKTKQGLVLKRALFNTFKYISSILQ